MITASLRFAALVVFGALYSAPTFAQCANPDGVRGEKVYNDDFCVMQYCDGTNWMAMTAIPTPCTPSDVCASVSPGDEGAICADGSVYAGQLTGVNLFVPPADNSAAISWNNGTLTFTTTGATSLTDGGANTVILDTLADAESPHQAAKLCAALSVHGKIDWYLPAKDELNVLYTNEVAIGGLAGWYWSSSEVSSTNARYQRIPVGSSFSSAKHANFAVRCMRR